MSLRSALAALSVLLLLCPGDVALAQETPAPKEDAPAADEELTPPVLVKDVKPIYPAAAEEAGIAAEVVLNVDIDATGKVENASVLQAADPAGYGFDEAAIEAAKQLVFEPAKLGVQAIPVSISYRFRFVPDVKEEPQVTQPETKAEPPPPPPPTGQLEGKLTERGTRLPITGVRVTIFRGEGDDAEGFETETDNDGVFLFEGLGVGQWRILADPEGYYPLRIEESVKENWRTKASYRIEKRSYNAYDVLVETAQVKREVSQVSISAKQAERIPGTFGDVLAVVQNFPGVARTQSGAEVVVRGSAPEDTRVYISGIDVPIIYHFGGLRSVLPVGMVERIDFYPGNFSVEYGRATGGIIDVDLKDLDPKKIGGYADISILDTSLYLEIPLAEKTSMAVAGRRSYIDKILGPLLPNDGTTFVLPRYYDGQALVNHRPADSHRLETFFFFSDDKFEVLFAEPVGDDPNSIPITDVGFSVNFERAIASHYYTPNKELSNELKLSLGRDRVNFNIGEQFFVNIELKQFQLRDTAKYSLSDKLTIRGGVDYLLTNTDYTLRLPGLFDEEDNGEGPPRFDDDDFAFTEVDGYMHSAATFVQAEYKPIDSLLLIPGVRFDYFSTSDEYAISPRATARYDIDPIWALKAAVGLFVQEALFAELDPQLGNPDLDIEKAMHYSLGAEWKPKKHIKIDVTGFYKTLHDIVVPTDNVIAAAGGDEEQRYNNNGAGRVIGMELSARHELADGLFGWVAYTLSRAERRDDGETEYRLFDYDQTHILTVIGSYQLPRNWEVSTRFRLVSGNLYTPYVGAVYDSDQDRYVGVRGPINSARVGAFNQIDFRIDKKWVYDTWMFNAYLDIQNVANRQNPEGINYNFDFSETTTDSGLPIVPVLGLRGEF